MVSLVHPHPPSFIRPPTTLPASWTSISLVETEVASTPFSQRLTADSLPLVIPPSFNIVRIRTYVLRPAPFTMLVLRTLELVAAFAAITAPALAQNHTSEASEAQITGLPFSALRRPLFPADFCRIAARRPKP
jgi:hypothetical protein